MEKTANFGNFIYSLPTCANRKTKLQTSDDRAHKLQTCAISVEQLNAGLLHEFAMTNKSVLIRLVCIFCVLLFYVPILAQQPDNQTERIIKFHADITIHTSGMISVAETITVFANGQDIKRGIVRSIPVFRTDKYGRKQKMPVTILSITRDGTKEQYRTENVNDHIEIFIGNQDVLLEPGIYEYVVTYESAGQIGFFDDYDELYWNVTGNYWVFNIEQASAAIILPSNTKSIQKACYTGRRGSTDKRCASNEAQNMVHFATNGALSEREGLTVAVAFPRDIISRPSPPHAIVQFWYAYRRHLCVAISLLIFGIFCLVSKRKAGKRPERPLIIPSFNPPNDWSPASVRYLNRKEYDSKTFTTALVSMAVKKTLRIVQTGKAFTLEPLSAHAALSVEERKIYANLFSGYNKSLPVNDKNHRIFNAANSTLTNWLQGSWKVDALYRDNLIYKGVAAALAIALLVGYAFLTNTLEFALTLSLTTAGIAGAFWYMLKISKSHAYRWIKNTGYTLLILFILCMLYAEYWLIDNYLEKDWISGAFIMLLPLLCGLYIFVIQGPTPLGAQTKTDLDGFRMYLKTAEEDRLNLLTPPEHTPELFERLLPYALAMDVENEWGRKFTDILTRAHYSPDWYDSDKPFTTRLFATTLAGAFVYSVGSARTDPTTSSSSSSGGNWSSGSGGGGYSGGGGGGGGGRGW